MNARKFIGASVLTIALMLGAAGTANAVTVAEIQACKALIDNADDPETSLREATQNTEFGGRDNRDDVNAILATLLSKIDDATAKLMTAESLVDTTKSPDGKIADALEKLIQYEMKVSSLPDWGKKAKISVDDKACLLDGVAGGTRTVCETDEGVGQQDTTDPVVVDDGTGAIGCVEDLL